jgi:hypothetical protein
VSVLLQQIDRVPSLYGSGGGDDGQHALFVIDRQGLAVFSSDLKVTNKACQLIIFMEHDDQGYEPTPRDYHIDIDRQGLAIFSSDLDSSLGALIF